MASYVAAFFTPHEVFKGGAEGKEKVNGVVVTRGLEEGQSESVGQCTRTGYEVWYTRDELAGNNEVLHPHVGCTL